MSLLMVSGYFVTFYFSSASWNTDAAVTESTTRRTVMFSNNLEIVRESRDKYTFGIVTSDEQVLYDSSPNRRFESLLLWK